MKMFLTDISETEANTIKFHDISSKTMKAVLEFIYTGNFSFEGVKSITNALSVAEKYELKELKSVCINKLMEKLDKTNVLKILTIADLYNAEELEKKCLTIVLQ